LTLEFDNNHLAFSTNKMELNLSALNCFEVKFSTDCEIDQNSLIKIKECSGLQKEIGRKEGIYFMNNYSFNKKKYFAVVFIVELKKKKNIYCIDIHYHLGRWIRGKTKYEPVSKLLECLKKLINNKITFDCDAKFEYPPSKYNSVVPLPIKLHSSTIDEIRGYRFAKVDKKELTYDIIVDRPENRKIYHNVNFNYEGELASNLPKIILNTASNISKRFVTKR